ncbi:YncE family protein [Poseidonibacter lekithochrous]|uniref:YncE family protein n=1 Tax=Poseidonibacter lekithochrous TaxID=1904463 RepID=UPI0008FC58BD|nr:hypothetical protein [Poseidonibacter lekithochrous]QKJ22926.1 hypothetical protein ALEK_1657 [Poseidonibacter lekithochrous]
MKKVFLCLSVCLIFGFADTKVISGFSSPESVIITKENVYVSNVGVKLEATTKDKDGFISKLSKDGKILELQFLQGLNAPKGMGITNNILYIADIDEIKGFDLGSKKQVFSLVFKNTMFLNDITIKDKNTLFVSSTDTNSIFEVDLKAGIYKKLIDFSAANGLHYEKGFLYAVELGSSAKTMLDGKGKLYKINLKNHKKTLLSSYEGVLDGVQKVGNKIYVSDWINFKNSGIVRVYDLKTKKESVLGIMSLHGAADFMIDEKSNKLYIPQMIAGKLSIIDLNNI